MFVTSASAAETTGVGEPAAETHAGTSEPHEGGAFPPFNPAYYPSQILWLAITFGLFYLFLKRVVLPRLGSLIENREAVIAGDLGRASALNAEADAAIAAYEQGLAEARGNANKIGQEARDRAKADAAAERAQVEASLNARLAEAEARIASIKSAAMQDVGAIAEETATAILEQLVGGTADRNAVNAAVRAARE